MKTTQLLAAGALAAAMLTTPTAALAGPATATNPAIATDPAIATQLETCATPQRYVPAIGPAGGHYVACPNVKWVPARGGIGGHYEFPVPPCVRYVPAIGPAGGYYISTCPNQPKWVPARGGIGGHYATATENAELSSITTQATTASSWSFDWGSAAVGAATMIAALAIALLAITELRRRRMTAPGTLTTTP
jgi:hypothetical protein